MQKLNIDLINCDRNTLRRWEKRKMGGGVGAYKKANFFS